MRKSKRVTIYDIAKKINASPSTVSRVLSNSDYPVSPEMRKKVLKAAKEMNYYPNILARNLKTKNSKNVGIVLPSISNPFYPSVVRGIEDVALKNDYTLFICSCEGNKDREKKYFQYLMENLSIGIIAIFTDLYTEGIQEFIEHGGVVVSVCAERVDNSGVCCIYFDKEKEGYMAAKHLIDLGHENIAILTPPLTNPLRIGKVEGYKRALIEAGIAINQDYIYIASEEYAPNYMDTIYECNIASQLTRDLLQRTPEVTGIICINDIMALGCIAELESHGYRVPEDYSVVGFDDLFLSNLVKPRLTTVRFEKYNVGRLAMEILQKIVEGEQRIKQYNFSKYTYLEKRESTGRPRVKL